MNNLKYLELQRLMRELQFVESDYLYQSEIVKISDTEFLKAVELILNEYPKLRELYESKNTPKNYDSVPVEKVVDDIIEESVDYTIDNKSSEVKKLYRDIAKTTHPDKIKNHKLNELYLEATEAYDKNDIVTLYKVCSELSIEFEFPEDYIGKVRAKIDEYKERVGFLEKTYTFQWLKADSISDKNKILVGFIRSGVI